MWRIVAEQSSGDTAIDGVDGVVDARPRGPSDDSEREALASECCVSRDERDAIAEAREPILDEPANALGHDQLEVGGVPAPADLRW